MTTPPPRDWDKELAEIDKLIAKTPAQPAAPARPQGGAPALQPGPRAAPPAPRGKPAGTWLRVGLGVALGLAVTQWPYAAVCGIGLFVYLGVVGMVTLAGLWGAVTAWGKRMGWAHGVSLLVMIWGLTLGAAAVLPRTGYARQALTWFCR